jgi:hypothetical protein
MESFYGSRPPPAFRAGEVPVWSDAAADAKGLGG